ncbi:CgeB family protein [Rothia nasimurium]|uniref:CgeB family protein n=1 Tax=Rothia nasimurium TaxID=85336 RepID=UPI001F2B8643|nr:glycosyltransferase [Rothia nasimurium]
MSSPKILLVSPVFHGYWQTIESSLKKLGYELTAHIYDAPGNILERIRNKALHDLPDRLRPAQFESLVTESAIKRFQEVKPDIVLVVKGDQLGQEWWDIVNSSNVQLVTWMYDEFRRMRYSDKDFDLNLLGEIASYSPLDVKNLLESGYSAIEVPLAYDADLPIKPQNEEAITFVGARYPGREAMLSALHSSGVPVKAFGKQWSRHWWDVARTRNFKHPGISTGRDLDRPHAYGVMAGSPATLNIHGDQDGFTMRTFEASGVGGLQIVDRLDIDRYYEPGVEVLTYSSEEELIEICQRVFNDPSWAKKIRQAGKKRTLSDHTFDERVKILETLWK